MTEQHHSSELSEFAQKLMGLATEEVDAITPADFFAVWERRLQGEPEEVVEVKIRVEQGEVVIREAAPLPVSGNEIRVGPTRLVLTLAEA
jgi:hypothetical protein